MILEIINKFELLKNVFTQHNLNIKIKQGLNYQEIK